MQIKEQSLLIKEKIFTPEYVNIAIADLALRVCSSMQMTVIPLFVLDNGYSTTFAGLTMTAFMIMAILSRPSSGNMVDTKGRFIILIIGAAIYCISCGLFIFTFPVWMLLVFRALQGLGFSFLSTGSMTLATDIIPESRMSEGIGYLGLTQTLAQVFAPALALVVMDKYGYHTVFVVIFIFSILSFVLRLNLRSADKHQPKMKQEAVQKSSSISSSNKKENPIIGKIICLESWKPSMLMVAVTFAFSGIGTFLVAYATERGIGNPGLYFSVSAIALAFTRLIVGKVHSKYGSVAVLAPGFSLFFLSLLGIYFSSNINILMIAGAFNGLGMGVLIPEINTLAVLSACKENRGLANSTMFLAMDMGMAIGAVSLGAFAKIGGLGIVFLISAAVVFVALLAYLTLRKINFWGESS